MFQFEVTVLEKRMAEYMHYMPEKVAQDTSTMVIAPMPGIVKSIAVEVGQPVCTSVCKKSYATTQNTSLETVIHAIKRSRHHIT